MIQIDIPMPKNCYDCPCGTFDDIMDEVECNLVNDAWFIPEETAKKERLNNCPLKEVPDNAGWISVKESLPPERETIFAKLNGTKQWNPRMFMKSSDDVRVAVRFEDGTRMVTHDHTFDGKWYSEKEGAAYPKRTVTHWMPNPELPKEET